MHETKAGLDGMMLKKVRMTYKFVHIGRLVRRNDDAGLPRT
jgi:hypothetical protein